MDAQQRALELFLVANHYIQLKPIFRSSEVKYEGLRDGPITESELIKSVEFIGFVDGLYANRNRFEQGTPQGLMTFGTRKLEPKDLPDTPGIEFSARISDLDPSAEGTYNHQYELGKSRRADLRRKP